MIIHASALNKMKVKDWNPLLGDIRNWKVSRNKASNPKALFTVVLSPKVSGYEHIYSEHHVDQTWLDMADGDEEYVIDYILRYFSGYLKGVADKINKQRAKMVAHAQGIIGKPLLPHDSNTPNIVKERKHKLRKLHGLRKR